MYKRQERPGVKFKDMELIGIPYRITVGRGVKEGNVEVRARWESESHNEAISEVVAQIKEKIQQAK